MPPKGVKKEKVCQSFKKYLNHPVLLRFMSIITFLIGLVLVQASIGYTCLISNQAIIGVYRPDLKPGEYTDLISSYLLSSMIYFP